MKKKKIKKDFWDYISDILYFFLTPITVLFIRSKVRFKVTNHDNLNNRLKESCYIIGNHSLFYDPVILGTLYRPVPRGVSNAQLSTNKLLRFFFKYICRPVQIDVGKPSINTIIGIKNNMAKGYSTMFYPEAGVSFTGETVKIVASTSKLIKKDNKDVICILFKGSALSQPRWADYKRKNKKIEMERKLLISKEELPNLTIEDIDTRIKESIYINHYDWQRDRMVKFKGKKRAHGIERIIYYCPECNSFNTIKGHKHNIVCSKCGDIGYINNYGFIENNKFDNTVDWIKEQENHINELVKTTQIIDTIQFKYKNKTNKLKKIGKSTITLMKDKLIINNKNGQEELLYNDIKYLNCNLKSKVTFTHNDKRYFFLSRNYFIIKDYILKGA